MVLKRISIISGHYGCGKTNFAINLALYIKNVLKKDVLLCDLDIVNPYFRSADLTEELGEQGIQVISPTYANTNLDIPALTAEIQGIFEKKDIYAVIDVGGDDVGAIALGRYARKIIEEDNFYFFYLINKFRYFEKEIKTQNEEAEMLRAIEFSSKLKADFLINSSNMAQDTTTQNVIDGLEYAENISNKLKIPIAYNVIPGWLKNDTDILTKDKNNNFFFTERYIKTVWE